MPSEEPEPGGWICEGCGEAFDEWQIGHSRAGHAMDCDGSCRNCPIEIQCGPISKRGASDAESPCHGPPPAGEKGQAMRSEVCDCSDDEPLCPKERAVMEEVKRDPVAFERLKAKCRWEAMSLSAVLREWGDPRTWDQPARRKER